MSLPRVLAIAGGALGVGYVAVSMMGDFKTPGIKNIEARHSAAGGGNNRTPAHASPMGKPDQVEGRHENTNTGVGSSTFHDNIADQKPDPSMIGAKWNKTHTGDPKGKGPTATP